MKRHSTWRGLVLKVLWAYYGDLLLHTLTSAGLFALLAVGTVYELRRIEREGLETQAVVSRVEPQGEHGASPCAAYVRFQDAQGVTWERLLSVTPGAAKRTGERLQIKYLPGCALVRPARVQKT